MERDPDHPIIARPWEYAVGELHYHVGLDGTAPYIEVTLCRENATRRLRFWPPRQFAVEDGFPHATGGMAILDVRQRGLEGLGV